MHGYRSVPQHPCLLVQPLEYGIAYTPIDFDPRQLDEVRELPELSTATVHVELERRGVRMNRDDRHLRSVLIEEEAVRDQTGHVHLYERGQVLHRRLELSKPSLANLGNVDVHNRLCHRQSSHCSCARPTSNYAARSHAGPRPSRHVPSDSAGSGPPSRGGPNQTHREREPKAAGRQGNRVNHHRARRRARSGVAVFTQVRGIGILRSWALPEELSRRAFVRLRTALLTPHLHNLALLHTVDIDDRLL